MSQAKRESAFRQLRRMHRWLRTTQAEITGRAGLWPLNGIRDYVTLSELIDVGMRAKRVSTSWCAGWAFPGSHYTGSVEGYEVQKIGGERADGLWEPKQLFLVGDIVTLRKEESEGDGYPQNVYRQWSGFGLRAAYCPKLHLHLQVFFQRAGRVSESTTVVQGARSLYKLVAEIRTAYPGRWAAILDDINSERAVADLARLDLQADR